ncbi:MAG: dihydroorotate dehydrogenase-like protein [candidate division KSB1 bacterium]|nr:dihydroorotate dehydrogenase-like protein [candidate division KSB1 bacterium]
MPSLQTQYLHLKLDNPIIVASSGLTKSVEKIRECEEAGAGAVVIKSMFEEVLAQEDYGIAASAGYHTEAIDYLRSELEMQYGPEEYCHIIREARDSVKIPVIASINCVSDKWWPQFAKKVQDAGAHALELNVFKTATKADLSPEQLEALYFDILEQVKKSVDIPVALKIGSNFSSLPNFAANLVKRGADGLVLFNRFTQTDIDIKSMKLKTTFSFSSADEMRRILRWTAILSGQVNCDFSATTGVKTGSDVVKLILAGASAVQVASLFYNKGLSMIGSMKKEIEQWMADKNIKSIDDFKGRLSFSESGETDQYLRVQFMEKIRGVE